MSDITIAESRKAATTELRQMAAELHQRAESAGWPRSEGLRLAVAHLAVRASDLEESG